ncbi:MAG: response regulator [Tabrizicola sp.]|nr:response regulator [Tabrizicola sp.]
MSEANLVMKTARSLWARWPWWLGSGVVCLAVSALPLDPAIRLTTLLTGISLIVLVAIGHALRHRLSVHEQRDLAGLHRLFAADAAPSFLTDDAGRIIFRNAAAETRFAAHGGSFVDILGYLSTEPDAVMLRLLHAAETTGGAHEDIALRGRFLRLGVHATGQEAYFWRIDEYERTGTAIGQQSFALPSLIADQTGRVLDANAALLGILGKMPARLGDVIGGAVSGDLVEINDRRFTLLRETASDGSHDLVILAPRQSEQPSETTNGFDHLPVALMTFAGDGRLRTANRAARDLLGADTLTDAMFHDLFEGLGRPVSDWLADVVAERLPGGVEVLRARHLGDESYCQITLRRVVHNGEVSALAVLSDATALKTLEAQFIQSQKMQAIGQLAGGIAHDFNNLLTAISGHCDLLLLRHGKEDPEYADLVQIHQNANRAAALVSQLLAFSRKQTLKPERLDLEEVLSELTHLLNRLVGERVAVQLVHGRKLGQIRADKRQLEQVLVNLVVNARDAMPAGGTVRIETEARTLTEEMRRGRASVPAGQYIVIRVVDHGTGIPADRLEKVFEPFFTTKRLGEGTGLGLSTAYGIVKQSGGFIFVDSDIGNGTTFEVYFPVHEAKETAETPPPEQPQRSLVRQGAGVVLLVEDEAPVRAFAGRALRLRGYTVLEAENAEEALRTLADPALEVDVFVTDVVMPGMDGPSWVKLALETRPNVRVIFMSGYAEDSLSEDQARIPNSIFLPKPFSLNELTATVQGQLH